MSMDPNNILWQLPAGNPPKGVRSNFVDPENHNVSLWALNSVWLALTVACVSIRMFSRHIISKQGFKWDDVFCILATLGSVTHTGLMFYGITIGYGRHMWDIRALSLTKDKVATFTSLEPVYAISIFFVKISLLMLFYDFFKVQILARRLIWGGFVLCTVVTIPYLTIGIIRVMTCNGIAALSLTMCMPPAIHTTLTVFAVCNIVTDFYVLLIPCVQIKKLQVGQKRKLLLALPFLAGFAASSMSIVRLGVIISTFDSNDTLWNAATTSQLTCSELNLAIICSCMIFFPAFLRTSKQSLSRSYFYFMSRSGRSGSRVHVPWTNTSSKQFSGGSPKDTKDSKDSKGLTSISTAETSRADSRSPAHRDYEEVTQGDIELQPQSHHTRNSSYNSAKAPTIAAPPPISPMPSFREKVSPPISPMPSFRERANPPVSPMPSFHERANPRTSYNIENTPQTTVERTPSSSQNSEAPTYRTSRFVEYATIQRSETRSGPRPTRFSNLPLHGIQDSIEQAEPQTDRAEPEAEAPVQHNTVIQDDTARDPKADPMYVPGPW